VVCSSDVAEQLGLFGDEPAGKHSVGTAAVDPEVRALAERLPPSLYLGTSSWSFPGWQGIVWDKAYGEQVLARRGLAAYARHPLLRSVGIDRTHYAPIEATAFREYAQAVPAGFRFLTKAHEACTLAVFPTHPRYGAQRGQVNPLFFDAAYARDAVVAPMMEGLEASAGPLLFQLAQQPIETLGGSPRRFAEKLYRFLRDLPKGPIYAVEVRNPQLLTPDYRAALRAAGAVHCINVIPQMPAPKLQPREEQGPLVMRWMLAAHHSYETALAAYRPFDRMVDPDRVTRRQLARLARTALAREVPVWLIANNKAEGSAPLTLLEFARSLEEDQANPDEQDDEQAEAEDDVPF
jgi:uncharacterized protein YecE (DUF72 family)